MRKPYYIGQLVVVNDDFIARVIKYNGREAVWVDPIVEGNASNGSALCKRWYDLKNLNPCEVEA